MNVAFFTGIRAVEILERPGDVLVRVDTPDWPG